MVASPCRAMAIAAGLLYKHQCGFFRPLLTLYACMYNSECDVVGCDVCPLCYSWWICIECSRWQRAISSQALLPAGRPICRKMIKFSDEWGCYLTMHNTAQCPPIASTHFIVHVSVCVWGWTTSRRVPCTVPHMIVAQCDRDRSVDDCCC